MELFVSGKVFKLDDKEWEAIEEFRRQKEGKPKVVK